MIVDEILRESKARADKNNTKEHERRYYGAPSVRVKPMLAVAANIGKLEFPVYASAKLDGIRVIIIDGVVMSRALKPIPNQHVQELFGKSKYNFLDGELIVGDVVSDKVFNTTTSGVMSYHGQPDVKFYVFDRYDNKSGKPYSERWAGVKSEFSSDAAIRLVEQKLVTNIDELNSFEDVCIRAGYEGVMIRSLSGVYKNGRSTVREGYLLKLKRFEDDEAQLVGMEELLTNGNEATLNNVGHMERSQRKSGMRLAGKLGALIVVHPEYGQFKIGTGFDDEQRVDLWNQYLKDKSAFSGVLVKFRFQLSGMKDKPRFPVFIGFRDKIDK